MKNQPQDTPAQPSPDSGVKPERDDLFQFLLKLTSKNPAAVVDLLSEAPPFVMRNLEAGEELVIDHYD